MILEKTSLNIVRGFPATVIRRRRPDRTLSFSLYCGFISNNVECQRTCRATSQPDLINIVVLACLFGFIIFYYLNYVEEFSS